MSFKLLPNNQVMRVYEVSTTEQTAEVEKPHCMFVKIQIAAPKTVLELNEEININFQWQLFDLQQGQHIDDSTYTKPFDIVVNGSPIQLIPVDGAYSLPFSSAEPGTYVIRSNVPGTDTDILILEVA